MIIERLFGFLAGTVIMAALYFGQTVINYILKVDHFYGLIFLLVIAYAIGNVLLGNKPPTAHDLPHNL